MRACTCVLQSKLKSKFIKQSHQSHHLKKSSLLFFGPQLLRLRLPLLVCLHPDGWDHNASLSCEGEGDALLIIGTFVDEERVKRLFALVLQSFTWEGLEQRVFGVEQAEVSVLWRQNWAMSIIHHSCKMTQGAHACTTAAVKFPKLIYFTGPWRDPSPCLLPAQHLLTQKSVKSSRCGKLKTTQKNSKGTTLYYSMRVTFLRISLLFLINWLDDKPAPCEDCLCCMNKGAVMQFFLF